jgi:hypothetical protein
LPLSGPNCSVTKRFSGRMETGASIELRRQLALHGASHTRPQMDAKGFVARAMRQAFSYRPSAIAVT